MIGRRDRFALAAVRSAGALRRQLTGLVCIAVIGCVGFGAFADDAVPAPGATQADPLRTAQFALPKRGKKGEKGKAAPPPSLPKTLKFEYVISSESEVDYTRNADLDSDVSDDSLTALPNVTGLLTYRPVDWLQLTGELKMEKLVGIREEDVIEQPDGELVYRGDRPLKLAFAQIFAKLTPSDWPAELTVGRRNFEDPRLWLYDTELDGVVLGFKPGDFRIEASVTREAAVDLDILAHEPRGHTNNYMVYSEYRGIEDHRFAGYVIVRDHPPSEDEGRPQFYGLNAVGNPSDAFNWWGQLGYVDGRDENGLSLAGYGVDVGGTYRFTDAWLQPSVTLNVAYGSGDKDSSDRENGAFRQTGLQSNEGRFGGVSLFKVYGEALDPELSNLQIYTVAAGFRPAASMFVDLAYHRYRLNAISDSIRGSALTAVMNETSKDVGEAFDIIVGFRNLFGVRGLGADLRAGWFFPGAAFARDGGVTDADKGFRVAAKFFY